VIGGRIATLVSADAGRLSGERGPREAGAFGDSGAPGLSKIVFSTTVSEPLSWPNTQLMARDAVETVREMKDKGSK
jgi:hypothetical protein